VSAGVLVTDADQRSSLAVVRSLGRAGYRVHACSAHGRALAAASRYCSTHTIVPDALTEPEQFADAVARVIRAKSVEVLLPITDPSVLAVLSRREAFVPARIPLPRLETYLTASDKGALLDIAGTVGLGVPVQILVRSPEERPDVTRLRFPVVLKPYRSVAAGMKHPVRHASDPVALDSALSALPASAFPVLIQERVVGFGVGLFLLVWDGRLQAAFAHRRLLEKPPSGGVSVRCESIEPDPDLLEQAERLLRILEWQGVAMVECKVDRQSGRAYLMEVNGRFWGSLQLAIDAGVDFPVQLVRLALGQPTLPVTTWRPGTRLRWSLGEIDHVFTRLRRSPASLALPPDVPSIGSVVSGILTAPFTGFRGEVLRWNDPAPALREAINWLGRA
jgi:predicted ATP-grasp superfamily ATP-dependent carboligase